MSEWEKKLEGYVKKKGDKVEIVITDYILVEYLHSWAEDWEIHFDTDNPNKPLHVIKFFVRER